VKEAKAHPGTTNQSVQIKARRLLESLGFALPEVLCGRRIPRPAQASGSLVPECGTGTTSSFDDALNMLYRRYG